VYGEPHVTASGATVIPVSRHSSLFGGTRPVGVFVIHDGAATWVSATDTTRIVLFGQFVALVTGVIATLAVLRRPPWPELTPPGLAALARLQEARGRSRP
jgi:hypothetical protein